MKRLLKILGVLVIVVAALAVWKREEIVRLMAVNSLFDEDRIVSNFSNMNTMFMTRPMSRGDGPVSPLETGPAMTMPDGFDQWLKDRTITSVIVLKDGKIVHESYHQGTGPDDLRISWSMAKSVLSALFGIVKAEGKIASLDDPVIKYAPALKGSAYEKATIRNVLTMSSGVKFNEDYLDFWSDINKMGRVLALGGSMDGFAAGLTESDNEPGKAWHYVSIDTHVIGMVIRGATGRDIPDLVEEKIFKPLGIQLAPYYVTDGEGVSFVLGGLNMTTRDYARFGQMIMNGGQWQGQQIVPADWIAESTRPQAPGGAGYGYQWWMEPGGAPGEFHAEGVYGQFIYFDPGRKVVIAVNAADRGFEDLAGRAETFRIFRAIATSLQP